LREQVSSEAWDMHPVKTVTAFRKMSGVSRTSRKVHRCPMRSEKRSIHSSDLSSWKLKEEEGVEVEGLGNDHFQVRA